MATSAYDCTTDDEGVYRLDAFPAIECWDTYTGRQVLGIVLSIVYVGLWMGAMSANDDNMDEDKSLKVAGEPTFHCHVS